MWMYAIAIFLISLTPGSFLFTAIYGLSVSLSVVAFGALVGDWIDMTQRLKGILIISTNLKSFVTNNALKTERCTKACLL